MCRAGKVAGVQPIFALLLWPWEESTQSWAMHARQTTQSDEKKLQARLKSHSSSNSDRRAVEGTMLFPK